MGRSITPKYVFIVDGKNAEAMAWDGKRLGKPTNESLRKHVIAWGKSFEAGQANEHVSKALGYIPYPSRAIVRENRRDGRIVAEWKAAMFQVW